MNYHEDETINKFEEPRNLLDFYNGASPYNRTNILSEYSVTSGVRVISVLLLRVGFILVQVGSIPVENAFLIIFRNIIEIAFTIFSYGFLGFYLSFGKKSFYGIINYAGYIGDKDADLSFATLGFTSCLLGTAIASSLLVARIRQFSMLLLTFFTSAVFMPILMCWCWSNHGWMTMATLTEERVAIKDFGGNLVIHVPSAIIGLIGALFLGRRILILGKIDPFSLGREYTSGIVIGYIFVTIGHIGLHLPTSNYVANHTVKDYVSQASVNSLMAIGAGILVVSLFLLVFSNDIYRYWIVVKCLQGGLAGLVTVSAGADVYSPLISFAIACGGTALFFFSSNLIQYSLIEDCCSIISIYLICGCVGILIVPMLASDENLGFSVSPKLIGIHLLWQFICLLIISLVTTVVFLTIFTILYATSIFRNEFEKENHERAKILHGKLPWKRYFDRLFMISDRNKEISPETNRAMPAVIRAG